MAELPPDPGKLMSVGVPYVDVNSPMGQVEDARRALAGAGDDFFARQQAENSLAYAQSRHSEAVFGHKRYEENKAYVDARNQEVLARDTNHNGKSDYQEREDARLKALVMAPVGLAASALVVGTASQVMTTGIAPSLPLMGAFAALASVAPKLHESTLAKEGPMQGFSLSAAKKDGAEPTTCAMGPAALFCGRADLGTNAPEIAGMKPAPETGLEHAPGADIVSPVRTRRVSPAMQMDVTYTPKPPTWARSGGGMNA